MRAFLSYAHVDGARVDALIAELDRQRVPYWIDRRDIPVSVPWLDEIREAIRAASVVVICESFGWYESQVCKVELLTATDLGKRVVHIDVVEQSAAHAAIVIHRALEGLEPVDHLHTDLLVRSAAWDRSGRPASGLVGGKLLARLQIVDTAGRELTAEARAFLEAGRKRARRRRMLRSFGVMFVGLCFMTAWLAQKISQEGEKKLSETTRTYNAVADAHFRTLADPYDGLRAAADEVRRGNPGELARQTLVAALDVPVPTTSAVLPDARLIGLAADSRGPDPVAVGAEGQVVTPTGALVTQLSEPVAAVASSPSGDVLAWTASGITSLRRNGAQASTSCNGDMLAVTTNGTALATAKGQDLCISRVSGSASHVRLPDGANVTALVAGEDRVAAGTSKGDILVVGINGKITQQIIASSRPGPVTDLDLSVAGDKVAVARDSTGAVDVYDTSSASLYRRVFIGDPVADVALSPDRRTVASATGNRIVLTDLDSGQYRTALRGPSDAARAVRWSSDGTTIWAVNGEARISQWRWHSGRRIVDDPGSWFVAMTHPNPEGQLFAVTQAGRVMRIDTKANDGVIIAETGVERVLSVSGDSAGTRLLLGTSDHTLVVVDPVSATTRRIPVEDCLPISSAFASNRQVAVVGCYQGPVRLFDLAVGAITGELTVPYGGVGAVTIGPDDMVYVAAVNGDAYKTDLNLTRLDAVLQGKSPTFWRSITTSQDGRTILLTGVGTGTIGHTMIGQRDRNDWKWYTIGFPVDAAQQSRAAAISPDGRYAAIGMSDGSVHFWLLSDGGGTGVTRTEAPGAILGMSYAGDQLLVATRQGVVDAIEPCTSCESSASLLAMADRRLADAAAMGLLPR